MPRFLPKFNITPRIASALLRIESAREAVRHLPITASVLASLRETARLYSTHYSTMIEGNRLTQEQYDAVHARVLELAGLGAIDATYMCPDFGPRRKPAPAMILEAARDLNLDLQRSCMIGDKASDVLCGHAAGTRAIFIRTGYALDAPCEPDFMAANMTEAVEWVLQEREFPTPSVSRPPEP